MTDLDFTLACDESGDFLCPREGCNAPFVNHLGVIKHHGISHDGHFVDDIVGADTWHEFLRTERMEKGLSVYEIIDRLPDHIGETAVRDSLKRFGFHHDTAPGPSNSVSRILALPHVTTIEEARAEAKRRREAQS